MKYHSGIVRNAIWKLNCHFLTHCYISVPFAWWHWIWDTWASVHSNDMWWRDTACRSLWRLLNRLYCKFWHARSFGKGSNDLVANGNSYFCHRSGQICFLLGYEITAKSLKWANIPQWWMEGVQVQSKIHQVCELYKEEEKAKVLPLNAY